MADSHSIAMPVIDGGKLSAIYKIVFLDKIYIGSSSNVRDRWRCHLKNLLAGKHHSRHLQQRFNKHPEATLHFAIVEVVPDSANLLVREQHYIDLHRTIGKAGYNTTPTAGSCRGLKRSAETCARMSESRKGKRFVSDEAYARAALKRTGLKQSEETKKKKSESIRAAIASKIGWGKWCLGLKRTPGQIEKMRAGLLGKKRPKRSLETRLKQSLALRGKKRTKEQNERNRQAQLRRVPSAPRSAESRARLSAALKGRIFTPEHCAAISRAKKGKTRSVPMAA